jgi:hypothetical protein
LLYVLWFGSQAKSEDSIHESADFHLLLKNRETGVSRFFQRNRVRTLLTGVVIEFPMSRSVNFPHLAKNARYGPPEFVARMIPRITHMLFEVAETL